MIKPKMLKQGDQVAVVSLSSGMGGEELFRHRYELGKQRLEKDFGLVPVPMPNALKGIEYLDKHPEARAADLMEAFSQPEIKAVFCMIGGDDTIRLLPHIDFAVIRNNPKIFMGYSDTTVNHFMMYKAGLASFYGPSILAEFAENGAMHDYTKRYIEETLFADKEVEIRPSPAWTSQFLDWVDAANNTIARTMTPDTKGFVPIQGEGRGRGKLIGGCLDVFPMLVGTELWPEPEAWDNAILFLETSEECIPPSQFRILLRGLAAQGIFQRVNGILFAKPQGETYYQEYHDTLGKVIGQEAGRPDLPILGNVNFGHNAPMCVLPYGVEAEMDCDAGIIRLLEGAVTPR